MKIQVAALICCIVVLATGCSSRPAGGYEDNEEVVVVEEAMVEEVVIDPRRKNKNNYAVVRTFFSSNREVSDAGNIVSRMGDYRGDVSLGYCDVSIPSKHLIGQIESPTWRFFKPANPKDHMVVLDGGLLLEDEFYQRVSSEYTGDESQAFIFFHGYNVSFDEAAKRTAQIAFDLGFKGAPVFYSWPSKGKVISYTVDSQTMEWAYPDIKRFIKDFAEKSSAKKIYIIAHSMGTRGATRAISSLLAERPDLKDRLSDVILAAPDIDAGVFKREIGPALVESGAQVTLYASSNDLALAASKKVNGEYRAGDSSNGVALVPGIDSIDASMVDTSLLGHAYIGDSSSILADMFYLMRGVKPAGSRFGMESKSGKDGSYVVIKNY
ncbi:MAG: hypothetical protein CVV09_06635 [Gammaproteobacteria bacterium HGW-Gammaproteobacteria-13]|nr:MAG: hypothetical protein CVV09_06635 [Gammaproteobacteria bacterium HGW-Gammaproteobacteria-13]